MCLRNILGRRVAVTVITRPIELRHLTLYVDFSHIFVNTCTL